MLADWLKYTKNLLAVIHRDGGEHTEEYGLEKSIEDARVETQKQTDAYVEEIDNKGRTSRLLDAIVAAADELRREQDENRQLREAGEIALEWWLAYQSEEWVPPNEDHAYRRACGIIKGTKE